MSVRIRLAKLLGNEKRLFFRRLELTLIVLSVLPAALAFTITYRNYSKRLITEIESANARAVEQISVTLGTTMADVEAFMWELSTDRRSRFFSEHHYAVDVVAFNRLRERMEAYKSTRSFVRSIYLYFEKTRHVLAVRQDDYNGLFEVADLDDASLFERYASGTSYGTFVEDAFVACYYPLFNRSFATGNGVIVLTIAKNAIGGIIEGGMTRTIGSVAVCDESGVPFVTRRLNPAGGEFPKAPSLATEPSHTDPDWIVSVAKLRNPEWRIVSVAPKAEILAHVRVLRRLTFIIVAIILGAAILLSYALGLALYRPIGRLVRLSFRKSTSSAEANDEFEIIRSQIESLSREKGELEIFVKSNRELMREKILNDLVRGRIDAADISHETRSLLGIELPEGPCVVLLVQSSDTLREGDVDARRPIRHAGLVRLARLCLTERGLHGIAFQMNATESAEVVLLISTTNMDGDALRDAIGAYCRTLCEKADDAFPSGFRFAVGAVGNGQDTIGESYLQAEKTLNHRLSVEKNTVMFSTDLFQTEDVILHADTYHRQIVRCLRECDLDRMTSTVGQIMADVASNDNLSGERVRNFLVQIVSRAVRQIEYIHLGVYREMMNRDIYGELFSHRSLESMQSWLAAFFRDVIAKIGQRKRMNTPCPNILEAERLVLEEYHDTQLSLTFVADRIGLNSTYLSHLFKKETGTSFHDYVAMIRIERSKELLNDEDVPLNEIAGKVGFGDRQSFTRQFKKHEGETPGRYRKRARLSRPLSAGSGVPPNLPPVV